MNQNQTAPAATADEIIALLNKLCEPLSAERTSLAGAVGRVLREPVYSPEDQPPFDRSAVDGYAIRADDTSDLFRVVDEIRAGDWKPRELQSGETVLISTGGALPGASLQIVMKEHVERTGDQIRITRRDQAGHIRFRGEDARAGQVLVEPGRRLFPGTLALLASVGQTQPLVTRPPRVLHLATGNEIIAPEHKPQFGQIRDSNSTLVSAFLQRWRVEPEQRRLPEEESVLRDVLKSALDHTDLILISGGASVGDHDFTGKVLEEAGFEILISKTNLRPGKPLILARRGAVIAFGLPGNPVAHFVCLNLFVRVAMEKLSDSEPVRLFQRGMLATRLEAGSKSRETFWPARLRASDGKSQLTPLLWTSSGDLTALAMANALIRVRPGTDFLDVDTDVEFVSAIS